jgi:hypothetical protein
MTHQQELALRTSIKLCLDAIVDQVLSEKCYVEAESRIRFGNDIMAASRKWERQLIEEMKRWTTENLNHS